MSNTVALFSGQGSQYSGMGKELYDNLPEVRTVYECAGDIFGFDVADASFNYTENELARTVVSQPVIFTLSAAAFTAAKELMPAPDAVVGHSLGEFAALWSAGVYSLEDGFKIIKARAGAMEEAAAEAKGAMYAVIGLNEDTVGSVCAEVPGYVVPANYNLPSQTVISGEEGAAALAAEAFEKLGARAVRLGVSSAFHTKMMNNAAKKLQAGLGGINFSKASVDFYSNLTGEKCEIEDYPAYFAAHMTSPVLFTREVAAMARDGLNLCVEFGPGKTGSTLVKRNIRSFTAINVEDLKGLRALGEALKN